MIFFSHKYALLTLCWTALFTVTESNAQSIEAVVAKDTTTTMELRANSGAHLTLKRHLAPSDTFSGSFFFLSERTQASAALLSVLDAETNRLIAKCQFNNRHFANNNNKEMEEHQTQWLLFQWRIEGGLLQCNTPESEIFFKLSDELSADFKQTNGYTLEISKLNATLCLRDLKTSDTPLIALQCPSAAISTISEGIHCGCSLKSASPQDVNTSVEFPLTNNSITTQNVAKSASAIAEEPLSSPIVFPMFSPAKQHAGLTFLDKNETTPIFDQLKVFESSSIAITAQSLDGTTLSLRPENAFTPAPEIWIRATRLPFHHNQVGTSTPPLPVVSQTTSVALTTNTEIFDISDLRAINAKTDDGDHLRDDSIVTAAKKLECNPECKMGGVCVTGPNGNVCKCPAGLLGRNCNIRNPCANALTCAEHYGPAARCIVNEEIMAGKSPPLFVEAPHICGCRDDNNEWRDCDELFKMEFGNVLDDIVSTTITPVDAALHSPTMTELEAFNVENSRLALAANNTDGSIAELSVPASASSTTSSSNNAEHSQFSTHHNMSNSIETASLSLTSSAETTATIFTRFPGFDAPNMHTKTTNSLMELSKAPSTVLVTPSSAISVELPITSTATNYSQREPVAAALPFPDEDNETNIVGVAPLTTPQPTKNIVAEIVPTAFAETDGDNGFERIIQHIHHETPRTNAVTTEMPNEFETNLTDEENSPITGGFVSQEKHGASFTDNFVTPENIPLPEAEAEEEINAKPNATPKVMPEIVTIDAVVMTSTMATNDAAESQTIGSNLSPHAGRSDVAHRSIFQNSAASWIIAVGVFGAVLILLAAAGACVGRYVRRSRRLHGKYNPSREESALATAYAMPMTSVGKEERLI